MFDPTSVVEVTEDVFAQATNAKGLAAGDVLLMKGGLWRDGAHGGGAAHRAPTIGPVPTAAHRLMLKVDVSENF